MTKALTEKPLRFVPFCPFEPRCDSSSLRPFENSQARLDAGNPDRASIAAMTREGLFYIFVSVKLPEPVHPDCAPLKVHVPEMVLLFTLP
jgi:hypothetical protein